MKIYKSVTINLLLCVVFAEGGLGWFSAWHHTADHATDHDGRHGVDCVRTGESQHLTRVPSKAKMRVQQLFIYA